MEQRGYPRSSRPFWLSPQLRNDLYAISEDSLYDGMRELETMAFVSIRRIPQQDTFDPARVRNQYHPNWSALEARPLTAPAGPVREFKLTR
jgi:hypothetical protein